MRFQDMPYERVEYIDIEKEFQQLMNDFDKATSGEEQYQVHKRYYEVMKNYETMMNIAEIRHDMNIKDEFYEQEQSHYDHITPKVENMNNQYCNKLYYSPYKEYLERKIGPVALKNIELRLKAFDEKLIPLIQKENALVTQYHKLIASAKIEYQGETLNLSLLEKYLTSNDRNTRREAYEKQTEFFLSIEDQLDQIYDEMVENRTEQGRMLGYDNYIELAYYRMGRNSYQKEEVEEFRNQVKRYLVPLSQKLHEKRKERLGLEKLSYIDEGVSFLHGNPAPIGTPEEILIAAQTMYSDLSEETKGFFNYMIENDLLDVLGRKDKKAGGYQTNLPNYKSPFIFANFNTTSGDVDVMTHECGHAFQAYVVRDEEIREHQDITMETAECHSMSMEFFTEPWMELFFGERTKDYINMHIEQSITFIPYGCMVDEFQHIIYEQPELSPKERKNIWMKLEKEYRPHMNYEDDLFFGKGGRWQKQQHIYSSPFYYIDYCLAMTCALQYKIMMDKDYNKAWKSYMNLCKASASDYFANMIEEAGLISPFTEGCIQNLVKQIEEKVIE